MVHRPVKTQLSPSTLSVIWLTDQSKQDSSPLPSRWYDLQTSQNRTQVPYPLGEMAHRPVKTGLKSPTLSVIRLTDQSKQDSSPLPSRWDSSQTSQNRTQVPYPLGDMTYRPVKTGLKSPTLSVIRLTDQSKQDSSPLPSRWDSSQTSQNRTQVPQPSRWYGSQTSQNGTQVPQPSRWYGSQTSQNGTQVPQPSRWYGSQTSQNRTQVPQPSRWYGSQTSRNSTRVPQTKQHRRPRQDYPGVNSVARFKGNARDRYFTINR